MGQSIILAAGNGSRLGRDRAGLPKPLVPVGGRTLIERALDQALAAGCDHAVVVLGAHGDQVGTFIERAGHPLPVRFAVNPHPELPNGVSLLAAEPLAREHFYLQMADHVFERPVLRDLAMGHATRNHHCLLLTDVHPDCDEADATKVTLAGDHITAIGKDLGHWDAIDAGCFLLDRRIFEALVAAGLRRAPSVSDGMRELIARGLLRSVPLVATRWADVDTGADLAVAEAMLASLVEPARVA